MANESDEHRRSVLPPAEPAFRGEINVAFSDSKADFPEPLRAPEGAPNVLIIVGDDIGYGHHDAFGGPGAYADLRPAGQAGPEVHQLPRRGRVRGVACLLADRAERLRRRLMAGADRGPRRYPPPVPSLPEDAVINTKNRSFTLTAELETPDGDAEGVLVTVGGETGGYALMVQNARPTFHYNWLGRERYTITSTEPLPSGPCTIRFDFAYDDGGAGKGGTGTLSVNDKRVADGRIDKTVPVVFSTDDTFDVGADWGTPVSPTYQPPFEFTGTLKQVTVEAK